ncbi:MAG TPA: alpha/beta fold hydrolase [Actinomycetota bacterium]|nr:alpha/beta fold hydrolase [Actinomycetota bacterium]
MSQGPPPAAGPVLAEVRFTTADGLSLEGELRRPDGPPRGTAVLCHPHPRHGGSKDHPLLWAIRNDLAARRGLAVLGFNFRGTMGSEGSFGGGEAEVLDVAAAVDRVRDEAAGPTALVGWSFGASVALRHATGDHRLGAVAMIAPPLGGSGVAVPPPPPPWELQGLDVPVLLLAGSEDRFCRGAAIRSLGERLPRAEVRILAGADHFFGRREREVAEAVGGFLDEALRQSRP